MKCSIGKLERLEEVYLKRINCVSFFRTIGFYILVAFVSLWGILLFSGAEVAFYAYYKYVSTTCTT